MSNVTEILEGVKQVQALRSALEAIRAEVVDRDQKALLVGFSQILDDSGNVNNFRLCGKAFVGGIVVKNDLFTALLAADLLKAILGSAGFEV
jgi:hypothetical protein